MDVSKQVVGMGAAHISGLVIAIVVHQTTASASECAWYFVAFTSDTTLGVLLTMIFHNAMLKRLKNSKDSIGDYSSPDSHGLVAGEEESWRVAIAECGDYGDPPSVRRWGFQAGEWALCVVLARALNGVLIVLLGPILQIVANGLDSMFSGHPTMLLFAVMICCPLLMNAMQLLIQDAVLKGRKRWGMEGGSGGGGDYLEVQLQSDSEFVRIVDEEDKLNRLQSPGGS